MEKVEPALGVELIGEQLGNWRIVRLLAQGGFGVVYEAAHVSIEGHRAAIKVLHKEHAQDPDVQRRFTGEANSASRIAHPNIVQIFDAGVTPQGICYIVMEFLDGRPLTALIEEGRLPPQRAAFILAQVASALAAAHDIGIVHRDLKPDNIIVLSRPGGDDLVKVLDFGIAKLVNETGRTRTGALLGTPFYMSPEQWQADKNLDGRSDIYSLGIILYETLSGERPFAGETALQCMYAHIQKPLPDLAEQISLPDELCVLLQRMAAKSPADRPARMQEVEAELRAVARQSSVATDAVSGTARLRGTMRRLRVRARAAIGAASLLVIPILILFWLARARQRPQSAVPDVLRSVTTVPADMAAAAPALPAELVVLGPSRFPIGSGSANSTEGPAHVVELRRFAISRYEVSFSALAEYEAAAGRKLMALQGINLSKFGNRPAVNLSRDEAASYCRWRYARFEGRLPSEEEWEFAARSGDEARLFPWAGTRQPAQTSQVIEPTFANLGAAHPRTFPIDSFEAGASDQGVFHLIGNASEWTSSPAVPYPGSSARVPSGSAVVRGGGANTPMRGVRSTTRWFVDPATGTPFLGFRCAATPPP